MQTHIYFLKKKKFIPDDIAGCEEFSHGISEKDFDIQMFISKKCSQTTTTKH